MRVNFPKQVSLKQLMPVLIGLAIISSVLVSYKCSERVETLTIHDIRSELEVSSNSDGTVSSRTHYYVMTQQGIYNAMRDGFFLCEDFHKLEKGKTYLVKTCGFRCDIIGLYPLILRASLIEDEEK